MKKRCRHLLASLFVSALSTTSIGCTPPHISNQYLTGKSSNRTKVSNSQKNDLKFVTFGPQQIKTAPSATLTDIVSHLPSSYGNTYYDSNLVTWGHETTHGINAHVRDNFNTTGRKANAFYVLEDRAVVVAEPRIIKRQVGAYVPTGLRGSRFSLYIEGQTAWDAQPLYILDEFTAYTNGSAVALDLHKNALWTYGQQDVLAGMIEFISYSLALGRAVKEKDSEYFQTYPQFTAYLGFAVERAMEYYRAGKDIAEFKQSRQEELLKILRVGDEGKELRAFASDLYGEEWVNRVILADDIAQTPDPDLKQIEDNKDDDNDGVTNRLDKCPNTVSGKKVWTYGDWIGCGEGEERS